jgi:hypothetical protein
MNKNFRYTLILIAFLAATLTFLFFIKILLHR